MILYINGDVGGRDFHYEMENLCREFFPNETIKVTHEPAEDEKIVALSIDSSENETVLTATADIDGKEKKAVRIQAKKAADDVDECERQMAMALFEVLTNITGYVPKWGILTGVRPAKLMRRLISDGQTSEEAQAYFEDKLLVSKERINLAADVVKAETPIIAQSKPESFSLYISIPFCPTRCSYCSFISHSVGSAKKLLPDYVKLLCREIETIGKTADELGLRLETVYYGGGTPTTLSAEQLADVMSAVKNNFDLSSVREYTVEAGRPDTITQEKLEVMKNGGAGRISINPQTFNDEVLKIIGRKHNSEQTVKAYNLTRAENLDDINMDVIAGLPGDSFDSFTNTVEKMLELAPENITIHTLALKRSSSLVTDESADVRNLKNETAKMLDYAYKRLTKYDYFPYYMYRQSRSVGNLENTGWCKKGREGLYNIYMMDETHTVLAAGAGAVSKLKEPGGELIERIFNYKYPFEYVNGFDEILKRKERIKEFYSEF